MFNKFDFVSLAPPRVLVLEVALDAVLLIVVFQALTHKPAHLINRIVELPVGILAFHRVKVAKEEDAVEASFDLLDVRRAVFRKGLIAPDRLAECEALEYVVHELLLPLHCDDVELHEVIVKAFAFNASTPITTVSAADFCTLKRLGRISAQVLITTQIGQRIPKSRPPLLCNARFEVVARPILAIRVLDLVLGLVTHCVITAISLNCHCFSVVNLARLLAIPMAASFRRLCAVLAQACGVVQEVVLGLLDYRFAIKVFRLAL